MEETHLLFEGLLIDASGLYFIIHAFGEDITGETEINDDEEEEEV